MDGLPGAQSPICTISMATLRWRTLKNVDVAIYEHGDVLVRGWSGADYAHAYTPPVPGVRSRVGFGRVRTQRAALEASDAEVVQGSQPHTRLIRSGDVAAVAFRPGIVASRIRLELDRGELVRILWMRRGPSRINPDSSSVERALQRAYGKRLQIS